ncbi:MAG: LPS translocon maturation chaperone LptM [Burkholderiaceae bacterium]
MEEGPARVVALMTATTTAQSRQFRSRILLTTALLSLIALAGCGTKGPLTPSPLPKRPCADGSPPPCTIRPPPDFSNPSSAAPAAPVNR